MPSPYQTSYDSQPFDPYTEQMIRRTRPGSGLPQPQPGDANIWGPEGPPPPAQPEDLKYNDPSLAGDVPGRWNPTPVQSVALDPSLSGDVRPPQQAPAPAVAGPAGIDPALAAIYQKAGVTPAGGGTGFADWQYWQDKPSQWDRLGRDLAGTGTDQPTGTPGHGVWESSGQGAKGTATFDAERARMAGGGSLGRPSGGVFGGNFGATGPQSGPLFDLLMKRANQSLKVDPNDPIIKGQVEPFAAADTRASRNYLSGVAERAGPNANIGAEGLSAAEKVGQDVGTFQGQLMQQELTARRQEIESALSGAAGLLTAEQQMQLQEELAQLQLAQQESQFGRGLGQQESEFARNLTERGYEFGQNMDYNYSPFGPRG